MIFLSVAQPRPQPSVMTEPNERPMRRDVPGTCMSFPHEPLYVATLGTDRSSAAQMSSPAQAKWIRAVGDGRATSLASIISDVGGRTLRSSTVRIAVSAQTPVT